MTDSLKSVSEHYYWLVENHNRLIEKGTTECLKLIPETKAAIDATWKRYDQLRTEALTAARRSKCYSPGIIIVLGEEQFAKDEHGELTRIA